MFKHFVLPCAALSSHGKKLCYPGYRECCFALFSQSAKVPFRTSFIKRDEAHCWQLDAVCFSRYPVIERHVNILIKDALPLLI